MYREANLALGDLIKVSFFESKTLNLVQLV